MEIFWRGFWEGVLPQHIVFFCIAYQLPLRKRSQWQLRCAAGLVISLFTVPLVQMVTAQMTKTESPPVMDRTYYITILLFLLVQLCAMALLFWFCCDIPIYDAIYGTACAYATQHLADTLMTILYPDMAFSSISVQWLVDYWPALIISVGVLLAGYYLVAVRLPENGCYQVEASHSWLSAVLVVTFAIGLNYYAKIMQWASDLGMFRVCMLFDLLCCVFVLWVQVERQREKRLAGEMQTERVIRARQKEQFEIARDSVERINRKCHDLKHQVAAIRRIADTAEQQKCLAELEQAVVFYDYMVKSGNEVIDTVLTEIGLLCEQAGITWTCMANGPTLEFMEDGELYLLFNSALENAIESVQKLSDPKQRIIALTLHRKREMAFLQIENYYAEPPVFEQGMPISTKPKDGTHGYGLKNIRSVVEKYRGTLDLSAENGLFLFSVLIPLPPENAQTAN